MDEGNSEKGPVIKTKGKLVIDVISKSKSEPEKIKGEGFVMGGRTSGIPAETSVEMRSGASNEEDIRRLNELKEKAARMTPEEREKEARRKELEAAARLFKTRIEKEGEYSEALKIKPTGDFDTSKRLDATLPYAPLMFGVSNPEDLYEFMQELQEQNPNLGVEFENDPEGQWLKYRVTEKV